MGIVAGLVLALWLTRALMSMLFGVTPLDAATLILSTAVVVIIGIAASLQPALRALKLDPILALRDQ
jgi:ABC-type antimicrobial peptide transport system permease subunit